jgi:hypothetical protein
MPVDEPLFSGKEDAMSSYKLLTYKNKIPIQYTREMWIEEGCYRTSYWQAIGMSHGTARKS